MGISEPSQAPRKGRQRLNENLADLHRNGPELLVSISKLLKKLASRESAEDINLPQKPLYVLLEHMNV